MRQRLLLGGVALVLSLSMGGAGQPLKSGIPVGGRTSAFHPLNVTGEAKDKKNCLV